MTTTINASTSSGLVVTPDNSGNVLLQYNGVAAPAFSVYSTATQYPATGTETLVVFGAEYYDTANCFNTSTSRFTPNVAGYYQFSASVAMAADGGTSAMQLYFWKNGSGLNIPAYENTSQTGVGYQGANASTLMYLNGTTDYVEVYGRVVGTGTNRYFFASSSTHPTAFTGCLLRGA